jgi:hypothetical protein
MKILFLTSLFFLSSCATKYIVAGNRFMTPESQGGAFRGQVELQQTGATQLAVNLKEGTVDNGVFYSDVDRFGFLVSNSLFNKFDILWSHTGSANSMLGGKFQILGTSRTENGVGHKLSLAGLFGANDYETDDKKVEFELSGREFLLIYGYRINENVLPYTSLGISSYNFSGKIKPSGLEPNITTDTRSLSAGLEVSIESLFAKLEATYQQLITEHTKDKDRFMVGYSIGFSW